MIRNLIVSKNVVNTFNLYVRNMFKTDCIMTMTYNFHALLACLRHFAIFHIHDFIAQNNAEICSITLQNFLMWEMNCYILLVSFTR